MSVKKITIDLELKPLNQSWGDNRWCVNKAFSKGNIDSMDLCLQDCS